MKFKIVYDNDVDTLRVRLGKNVISREQSYGLSQFLSKKDCIQTVKVSSINGSIFLKYIGDKRNVLKILANITRCDIKEVKPTNDEVITETNNRYINKILRKICTRYFFKFFMPLPIRLVRILYEAAPYLASGFDSLRHLRLDVDLLDATSIFVTLTQGMYAPAGSIVFLLGLSEILEEYTIEKTKHSLEKSLMLNINKVWVETESGEEIAGMIFERHNLLSDIFVKIGVDPETAREDACKIEHDLSEETFE
ncbi:MAG: iron dependent repressor, metal binding and dimerization domain protein, partial [Methanosphaera sp.]|nr:iron dependent repressor, metal binding and dimerization domain protein [Methanosphaera sp.]